MVIDNLCPVCGYEMEDPPRDYNICSSCGTEFGHHNINASVLDLRKAWLKSGPVWWSVVDAAPENWQPFNQILRIITPSSAVFPASAFVSVTATSSNTMKDWDGSSVMAYQPQSAGIQPEVVPW